ncbi:LamG domain-containing protein [Paenibacillus sp. chi10]|uniref:LamG domain-containing protein n=1 Tax=Paenibacillus suaedae TaxID=3077233 RepID=A0AAJ2N2P7_9BACL|nr:LamG domain-containing protein [Paenibacillus sp. chi10]MDT8975075.1 LamG domain-containing protein [Paenibacillus sp. chi10]
MKKILSSLLIFLVTMLSAGTSYAGNNVIYEYDANGNLIRKSAVNVAESGYIPTEKKTFTGKEKVAINAKGVSSANNAKTTVQFWMKWNGNQIEMPFSWANSMYDLYFNDRLFGFNTGNGDLYGTSSDSVVNKWVHVSAIFTNGDTYKNELYINGVRQTLVKIGTASNRNVADSAYFSGWNNDTQYQFHGNIAELKVWNRALNPIEIESEMYKTPAIGSNLIYVY